MATKRFGSAWIRGKDNRDQGRYVCLDGFEKLETDYREVHWIRRTYISVPAFCSSTIQSANNDTISPQITSP